MGSVDQSDLREGILRVSLQLGTEMGADGLTMRSIAKRLGVSATALYQHFESKSAILRAIRFEGLARLHECLEPAFAHPSPIERLRDQGVRYIKFAIDNPWLYSLLIDDDEEDWSSMTEVEKDQVLRAQRWVGQAFHDGVEQGALRRDTDLRVAPMMLWASMHGIASLMLRGRVSENHPRYPIDNADRVIEQYVRTILRGYEA